MSTREYKRYKGLSNQNLRDNMTTTEVILNMLAETSTKDISKATQPVGLSENMAVARRGGHVADVARQALESETGQSVISRENVQTLDRVVTELIDGIANETSD